MTAQRGISIQTFQSYVNVDEFGRQRQLTGLQQYALPIAKVSSQASKSIHLGVQCAIAFGSEDTRRGFPIFT